LQHDISFTQGLLDPCQKLQDSDIIGGLFKAYLTFYEYSSSLLSVDIKHWYMTRGLHLV